MPRKATNQTADGTGVRIAPGCWSPAFWLALAFWPAALLCLAQNPHPTSKTSRGYTYIRDQIPEGPISVHILKVARASQDLHLDTILGHGTNLGMGLVSDQANAVPPAWGRPVAAINGDFFYSAKLYAGDPRGLQIAGEELISAPCAERACFWLDAAGRPHRTNVCPQFKVTWPDGTAIPYGLNQARDDGEAVLYTAAVGASTRAEGGLDVILEHGGSGAWMPLRIGETYTARVREVRRAADNSPVRPDLPVLSIGPDLTPKLPPLKSGALLRFSTATIPDLKGAKTGLGGGPTLVKNGQANAIVELKGPSPRTALGWNKDFFFLVVVDGRQSHLSIGMTLNQLSAYLVKIGCTEALNLDGGGSTTFWLLGNVMNNPSTGQERAAANALILLDKSKQRK